MCLAQNNIVAIQRAKITPGGRAKTKNRSTPVVEQKPSQMNKFATIVISPDKHGQAPRLLVLIQCAHVAFVRLAQLVQQRQQVFLLPGCGKQ